MSGQRLEDTQAQLHKSQKVKDVDKCQTCTDDIYTYFPASTTRTVVQRSTAWDVVREYRQRWLCLWTIWTSSPIKDVNIQQKKALAGCSYARFLQFRARYVNHFFIRSEDGRKQEHNGPRSWRRGNIWLNNDQRMMRCIHPRGHIINRLNHFLSGQRRRSRPERRHQKTTSECRDQSRRLPIGQLHFQLRRTHTFRTPFTYRRQLPSAGTGRPQDRT